MIDISENPEGCVLMVRAQPGARRNGIQGEAGGMLKVAVTAAPNKGRANQAIIEVLRNALGLRSSQIELIGGFTQRQKKLLIRGHTQAQVQLKLAEMLHQ
jgi:uncharacterized protein (TIGR00251 family)